ncbi:hydroxymethylglutaryl-CoA reductase [Lentilactobacillus senioris DSM 24302 = JCM 17472]|uniref:3-hydroxy-3-methylglutaryl coenzyme A reductase n=2 Tax=Lentilactobacillus senioris TaxID=931534 RepID=A0A0R2CSR4_9LACO|nr:hydroxymethylglutaryl-CoA reductase, degradative [Lentilactobacillus senioris]KRM94776.1 hydroxymethylglutaryl-CoA reductase [Lentilactobacillus senioris DSM 24302 = JCM 17472]
MMANQIKHFYRLSYTDRLTALAQQRQLTPNQITTIKQNATQVSDSLIENYLTDYRLSEGVLPQIRVNDHDYVVPMVTEEPSVIAAASHGAKLMMTAGITAQITERLVEGQVIVASKDAEQLAQFVVANQRTILQVANASHPTMQNYGGGAKAVTVRQLDADYCSVDLQVGVGEAMGANVVNTMSEAVADYLRQHDFIIIMSILTNEGSHQLVTVSAQVPVAQLAKAQISGAEIAQRIQIASHIAQIDPKRAVTHNKGIMNGVDAAVIATGNDWRAVEAAVQAFASRDGQYRGLSQWQVVDDQLIGKMTLPLPMGLVGGATKVLKLVSVNRQLSNFQTTQEAMSVIAAVGLAQNLAALLALVSEGIQAGHMKLQLKSMAMANGATPTEVPMVIAQLAHQQPINSQLVKATIEKIRQTKGE